MITTIIVAITAIVSVWAFNNKDVFSKLQLNPYQVYHRKEYYRLLTHGFIHADWTHLIVNMLVFFSFGTVVEQYFKQCENEGLVHYSEVWYVFMYLSAIIISSLTTLKKQRDNWLYNAVGASGAVSAILFCSIFFSPLNRIYIMGIIPIPGIIFGPLYLFYCQYMGKRNMDNINHDAHFIGAVYGFLFPLLISVKLIYFFINQLLNH
jgi:membrane associated rhomboid family serine protease